MAERGRRVRRVLPRGLGWMALVMLLAGCASIPLGTLWAMRGFGADDLARLRPEEVRVAVLVKPDLGRIDPARSHLALTLTPHDGEPEVHAFGLVPAPVQGGAIVPGADRRWQVLQLDAGATRDMRALLPHLADVETRYRKWALNVSARGLEDVPRHVDTLYFSVRVQLAHGQAPLTLFDRAPIAMERD